MKLPIYYEGTEMAVLEQTERGFLVLTYHDDWVKHGFDISVSLPCSQSRHEGDVVRAFFENMLPEGVIRLTRRVLVSGFLIYRNCFAYSSACLSGV